MNNVALRKKEALINELKGNLFEYLFAQKIAIKNDIESEFVEGMDAEIFALLRSYSIKLQELDFDLYCQLPQLAQSLLDDIWPYISFPLKKIQLIGKIVGKKKNYKEEFFEADILLKGKKIIPLSLKFSKDHSYVNTKSGGVKSFIAKYFSSFNCSLQLQSELNIKCIEIHLKMMKELYDEAGLQFLGNFDKQWDEAGYSQLPGQLPVHFKEIVLKSYYEIIKVIYKDFLIFFNENKESFFNSLLPLLGLGRDDLIQIICFHGEESGSHKKIYKGSLVIEKDIFCQNKFNCKILELKKNLCSFEIMLGDYHLQIRIKPMNAFTAVSPKVNCSLKRKGGS